MDAKTATSILKLIILNFKAMAPVPLASKAKMYTVLPIASISKQLARIVPN